MYITIVRNDIIEGLQRKGKWNMSRGEHEAFKRLLHDDNGIIRPADKGSGIVLMDKDKYLEGLHHEMEKSCSYIQTYTDETSGVTKKVKQEAHGP